ncbi:MAG TPA: RNA polymerase sigma factor [Gemmatimonadaceae bacterium]|jgi:RNA polymerase sigma-70 factor (ECF subfamily)|nr:RNA polymerase sigma factor [Gemmatimonadaceae bacterium]
MDSNGRLDDGSADLALIERWKGGDQRAAAEIVRRHAQALARFAASSGEREEVDELVQDTFVRAFNSLDTFRADSTLRTWLFTILRRLLLDRRRAEKRRKNQIELDEGHAVQAYDALDALVADETALRVRKAMEKLSPLQKEVFVLRVTEGMAYGEIAKLVGSTEGACRVHYHNAMRSVKEFLDDA